MSVVLLRLLLMLLSLLPLVLLPFIFDGTMDMVPTVEHGDRWLPWKE